MPGPRALAFASRWFDAGTVHRTFEPLIADWQREWDAAPAMRRPWIRLHGLFAFMVAILVSSPRILATATPPPITRRVIWRVACFITIAAVLLAVPVWLDLQVPFQASLAFAMAALLPSGMVLALPFAMLTAVDIIRRDHDLQPHVARAAALKLAGAAIVVMIIGHGFLVPTANQQYRRLTFRLVAPAATTGPAPGLREMTTLELLVGSDRLLSSAHANRASAIQTELNSRAVMSLMPAVFVWLRWISHDVRKRRRFWPLPITAMLIVCAIGFFASYFSGFVAENAMALPPGTGLWLPIIVAAIIGMTQQWVTSRRRAHA